MMECSLWIMNSVFVCFLLFCIHIDGVFCKPRTVYMERICGDIIRLHDEPKAVLQLKLTTSDRYADFMNCHVTVVTQPGMHIGVTFQKMDITSYHTCDSDYLHLYDGVEITRTTFMFTTLHKFHKFCGTRTPSYLSSQHSNITLRFVSDAYLVGKGFSLLLTSFRFGSCEDDEFECSNSRCIHHSLQCNGYDNCGDGSDGCTTPIFVIVGIAMGALILVIALVVLCSVLRYRLKTPLTEATTDVTSLGSEYI